MRESVDDTPVPIALSLINKTTNIITDKVADNLQDFLDALNTKTAKHFININIILVKVNIRQL